MNRRVQSAARAAVALVLVGGLIGCPVDSLGQGRVDAVTAAIDQVKASVVAVGTFKRNRQPQFSFRGTGFVVGDGRVVATSAHVIAALAESGSEDESLAVVVPSRRAAERLVLNAAAVASDIEHDLAVLRVDGPPLPALKLGDSHTVRDGQQLLFTGFPIGGALGLIPVTHQAMVAAVTPIVMPAATAGRLEPKAIRQIQAGSFDIFQLDAVAYPGNSGSPLYDPNGVEVLGVITMTIARDTKESGLPSPTGIAFAVPVRHLQALLGTLK